MARRDITASRKKKKHSVLTKAISQSGYDTSTLIQDIQKSASVFYGNKPIYIHNNGRNFATAATIANTKLGTELIKLRKIWESEARELIQLCEQNENIFFSRVQSATNKKYDKQRASYYNFFTDKTWGDGKSYHFSIDSSLLGISETCDIICSFINKYKSSLLK